MIFIIKPPARYKQNKSQEKIELLHATISPSQSHAKQTGSPTVFMPNVHLAQKYCNHRKQEMKKEERHVLTFRI